MRASYIILLMITIIGCNSKPERKGFSINRSSPEEAEINKTGLHSDSIDFKTRPNGVLFTSEDNLRLIPIYKLNKREKRGSDLIYYTGSNSFYSNYVHHPKNTGNNWHNNFMPGFEAMYGYNLVNVHLYDITSKKTAPLFKSPVLIKTLYYPTFSKDTLNGEAVKRNYYMISAYNDDTNGDGYINSDDLRRFFLYNSDGSFNSLLVPKNYSVRSSQYDPANDFMYVYAVMDQNSNGHHDETENVHVFWIDLKDPSNRGLIYQ